MNKNNDDLYQIMLSRVFSIKYTKLENLSKSDNADDILEISAILRHFLLDGNRLSDDISNLYGLTCTFPLTNDYIKNGSKVFKEDFIPSNNAIINYSRDEFLKLKCISIDQIELSIKELIDIAANNAGGVHHNGKTQELRNYAVLIFESESSNNFFECLRVIAKSVIEGHSELKKAVNKEFSFLEQRKRKKQPELIFDNKREGIINFKVESSLESYFMVDFNKGGSILFSFIPPQNQNDYPSALIAFGSRRKNEGVNISFISNTVLELTIFKSKVKYSCRVDYDALRCNFLFLTYELVKKEINVNLFCFGNKLRMSNLKAEMDLSRLEGKIVIGQDLKSRNGSEFQSEITLIHFPKVYGKDDFLNMIKTKPLNEIVNRQWNSKPLVNNDKVYVTRMYNQGN